MENVENAVETWSITAKKAPKPLEKAVLDYMAYVQLSENRTLGKPEAIVELLQKGVEAFRNEYGKKLMPAG